MTLLLAAAALVGTAAHSETISYRDKAIDLHYHAHVELQTQAKGVHAPTRGQERSCHWQAQLIIERKLGEGNLAQRRLPVAKRANGVLYGPCHPDSSHVQRAANRALGDLHVALREAALHDRSNVLAEMEAAHPQAAS